MIWHAIVLGFLLSLVLIGPVFFLLIETSLTKGWKSAIALDLGVVAADILVVLIAYFGSYDLVGMIQTHPSLYKIGGFIIFIYGLVMYFSKPPLHIKNDKLVDKNYFKTFLNGFLMNLINVGIVVFWFVIVSWITINYPARSDFFIFMGVALGSFFALDLVKIFLAKKLQERVTDNVVYKIRKIMGILLCIFGIIITLKGFFSFEHIEEFFPKTPFQ